MTRWLWTQRWEHFLFAHWRVESDAMARLLPAGVEPELYDGGAWLGLVAFVMRRTRPCFGPGWPALPPIPELNVRTYVRVEGEPAVWFLTLDAASPMFANVGRALYGLDYRISRMAVTRDGDRFHYLSTRSDAAFAASYEPQGGVYHPRPGLEQFLVERYRLFALRRGKLVTAEVAHDPWPLQRARAAIHLNHMAPPGLSLLANPVTHYSRGVDAFISAPTKLPMGELGSANQLLVRAEALEVRQPSC